MKSIVCVKRVPESDARIRIAADGESLDPSGVKFTLNPYDEFALEEAIALKEEAGEGSVTAISRAPDARAFHEETVRKLDRLHLFDCLRANKSMAAWGVEARVPFLDTEMLDIAMRPPSPWEVPSSQVTRTSIERRSGFPASCVIRHWSS